MAIEIERKFLVDGEEWKKLADPVYYSQAYLHTDTERTVRVRIVGEKGFLTIKGITQGIVRKEFEYEISKEEARELLDMCTGYPVNKYRRKIEHEGMIWEVDEFTGKNTGLIIAEVELQDVNQKIKRPTWIGEEVSGMEKFYNSYLSENPYCDWQ